MGFPASVVEAVALPTAEAVQPMAERTAPLTSPRPSGAHVTEGNAKILAFVASFTAASSEAISMLSHRQETRWGAGGELPTVRGTEQRLAKLVRLGAIEKYRNQLTGVTHYGITKAGIGAGWSFGYNLDDAETIRNLSIKRLTHYQMIAHVAAQLVSPEGYFRSSLGIEPVTLDELINERSMRIASDPVKKRLQKNRSDDDRGDFGRWRSNVLDSAKKAVHDGRLRWSDLVEARPALLTMGAPQRGDTIRKAIHEPDLVVHLDAFRTDERARNIAVEVELSKKSWDDYDAILATWAEEFRSGLVYDRGVYITPSSEIESLLRRVDEAGKYGLIESGKLQIVPLLHRDGNTPIKFENRVKVGGR